MRVALTNIDAFEQQFEQTSPEDDDTEQHLFLLCAACRANRRWVSMAVCGLKRDVPYEDWERGDGGGRKDRCSYCVSYAVSVTRFKGLSYVQCGSCREFFQTERV